MVLLLRTNRQAKALGKNDMTINNIAVCSVIIMVRKTSTLLILYPDSTLQYSRLQCADGNFPKAKLPCDLLLSPTVLSHRG